MEIWIPALLAVAFLVLVGGLLSWTHRSGERSVRAWAKQQGWILERCERIPLSNGPFKYYARGKSVWTIRARNAEGQVREGWALSADPLSRDPACQVEVAWCEPGPAAFR